MGLLRCSSGVLGVFDCGFRTPWRSEAQVFGSEGALTIIGPYTINAESKILLCRESGEEEITVEDVDVYRCEVDALNAAILGGAPLPVRLTSSRGNVAAISALYESARCGLVQAVPAV